MAISYSMYTFIVLNNTFHIRQLLYVVFYNGAYSLCICWQYYSVRIQFDDHHWNYENGTLSSVKTPVSLLWIKIEKDSNITTVMTPDLHEPLDHSDIINTWCHHSDM